MLLFLTPLSVIDAYLLYTYLLIIRLEARLQRNIGFTLQHVLVVFTRLVITSPKVNRFGWNLELWVHCRGLALADFGHDLHISNSWQWKRSEQNFENFTVRSSFSKKWVQKFIKRF